MTLLSDGIDFVRAIELPAGIGADGNGFAAPRTALVRWRSTRPDKFYQVYVNGRFAGATIDFEQREIIVPLPNSFNVAVRIEIFAVEPKNAYTDFSSEIGSTAILNGRVKIKILRSRNLPPSSQAVIYFDNATGQIDYENQINKFQIRIWPAWQDKSGFAMSKFGASDFGYEHAANLGFGRGLFGQAEFGSDGDAIEWISRPLHAGVYKFAVKVFDEKGRQCAASRTEEVVVMSTAEPAKSLEIVSFDKQTDQLLLNVV